MCRNSLLVANSAKLERRSAIYVTPFVLECQDNVCAYRSKILGVREIQTDRQTDTRRRYCIDIMMFRAYRMLTTLDYSVALAQGLRARISLTLFTCISRFALTKYDITCSKSLTGLNNYV